MWGWKSQLFYYHGRHILSLAFVYIFDVFTWKDVDNLGLFFKVRKIRKILMKLRSDFFPRIMDEMRMK
jgi:hypothetical protein